MHSLCLNYWWAVTPRKSMVKSLWWLFRVPETVPPFLWLLMCPEACVGLKTTSRVKSRQKEGQARTVFWEHCLAGLSASWWEPGLLEIWLTSWSRRHGLPWIQTWLPLIPCSSLHCCVLGPQTVLFCLLNSMQKETCILPSSCTIKKAESRDQVFSLWLWSDSVVLKFRSVWCKEPGDPSFPPSTYSVLS